MISNLLWWLGTVVAQWCSLVVMYVILMVLQEEG